MASIRPRDLIDQHLTLFSLPALVLRLNEMVEDPACSAADIGNTIACDPALTARLLRIVNSPFYGFPQKVDTIPMAVTILGTRQLRDLVLATAVVHTLRGAGAPVEAERFWRHSVACGLAARETARALRLVNVERLFIAGLLHDIGKLVMLTALPEGYRRLLDRLHDEDPSAELEQEVFGFDHTQVGRELMRRWRLPESLVEPVAWHHAPHRAERHRTDAFIVHLANHLANQIAAPVSGDTGSPLHENTTDVLGLAAARLERIRQTSAHRLDATLAAIYEPPPRQVASSA